MEVSIVACLQTVTVTVNDKFMKITPELSARSSTKKLARDAESFLPKS